ncbi:MAG: class I SAM-dependent methyltransferase [Methylococcales bacterium]|nr:class I SAM-dependent methyltransferase [Methylococcales bacterium]
MSDWTDGYVADIDTTFGYYSELNPQRLRLAFLNTGLRFPEIGTACELGFGQGMNVNLHAAASVMQWFGTDVNPAHTQFAQTLAEVSGTNAQLFEQAFAEFCSREDLPDFDYIGLHGVWSWISDENRAVIVDFLRRKLKVGGIFYVNYHTQAGWAAMMPICDLLVEHADIMGSRGQSSVARFDAALGFAEQLLATQPNHAQANPRIADSLATLKIENNRYLAYEYFNRNWQPLSFSQTSQLLSAAKLTFACSAYYLDQIDSLNLTDAQQDLLDGIPDAQLRETVQDLCTNQPFRRDYWVKGAVRLNELEQTEALYAERVVLVQDRADVSFKVTGALGESLLHDAIYNPILDALSDYQPKTLEQIEQVVAALGINLDQVIQAVMVLIGAGVLCPAQDDAVIVEAKKQTDKLNLYLCHKARGSSELSTLASPVTGGGIAVSRFLQLFLLAKAQGYTQPEQWAQFVWSLLAMQNQCVIKDGVALQSEQENLAELMMQAHAFANKQLPIFMALGLCF